MTNTPTASPAIHIAAGSRGVAITQHRPAVLSALAGLPVARALQQVPRLLPICGAAQSIAAARAAEAARGERPRDALEQERERQLRREQALSAGWRVAVDWPDLLGRPRLMAWLKALRGSEREAQLAALLERELPGLEGVATVAELAEWTRGGEDTAATTVRRALEHAAIAGQDPAAGELPGPSELADLARATLAAGRFDPAAPVDRPVEVGPLAMARDPLIAALRDDPGVSVGARMMALLLDMRAIARQLRDGGETGGHGTQAWSEGRRAGTGRAVTARGPVFHRVELDGDGNVARWRAVAPTDWHFAPRGAVARALDRPLSLPEARLLVGSFDPCAPWTLDLDGER